MKQIVLQKTKYLLANSWLGILLSPPSERNAEKSPGKLRQHPAESRLSRNPGSKVRP